MQEVLKDWEGREWKKNNRFDIMIDTGESWIFWAKGSINAGYDENGNYRIWDFCIADSGLQFPDWECDLKQEYLTQIERFVTE